MIKDGEKVICNNCGVEFAFDIWDDVLYDGKPICPSCYNNDFGFCEVCNKLHKYEDMIYTDEDGFICNTCRGIEK